MKQSEILNPNILQKIKEFAKETIEEGSSDEDSLSELNKSKIENEFSDLMDLKSNIIFNTEQVTSMQTSYKINSNIGESPFMIRMKTVKRTKKSNMTNPDSRVNELTKAITFVE